VRHTRKEVIDRTRQEFERLDRLLSRLKPADWRRHVPRPETKDPWTVKDALAHITYWKEHSARVFAGKKRPPEFKGLEVNEINALIYGRWRSRRPAEVVAWHKRIQIEVIETLETRPDEWFGGKERGANWPGDFDGHSAWHRVRDMEAAVKSQRADRSSSPGRE
jgi:Mycothiol maleylpyruvate isomerase N-terminal domain